MFRVAHIVPQSTQFDWRLNARSGECEMSLILLDLHAGHAPVLGAACISRG